MCSHGVLALSGTTICSCTYASKCPTFQSVRHVPRNVPGVPTRGLGTIIGRCVTLMGCEGEKVPETGCGTRRSSALKLVAVVGKGCSAPRRNTQSARTQDRRIN